MTEAVDSAESAQEVEPSAVDTSQQDTIETRAREMGWTPKEDFHGKPENWRSAEEFVQRGETEIPLIRAENRRLQASLKNVQGALKTLAEHHTKTAEREYTKAFNLIKQQQREAAANGDAEAFDAYEAQIVQLAQEVNAQKPIVIPDEQQAENQALLGDWRQQNVWYNPDIEPGMVDYANHVGAQLKSQGVAGKQLLIEVSRAVEAQFPHKFKPGPNDAKPTPRGGEAGGRGNSSSGGGFRMTAEENEAWKELEKCKIPGFTKEKYIAELKASRGK